MNIRRLMIQTVQGCNSFCTFCPHVYMDLPVQFMEPALFERIIRQAAELQTVTNIMPYLMNEPLLDHTLFDKIAFIKEIMPAVSVHFLTNGILIDSECERMLLDSPVDWVGISVPSVDPQKYNSITGRTDGEKIISRLTGFAQRACDARGTDFVMLSYTGAPPYTGEDDAWEFHNFWKVKGIKRVELFFEPVSRAGNSSVVKKPEYSAVYGCKTLWANEMMHILADGSVIPCCMDWSRREVLGSAVFESLNNIWNGSDYTDFRNRIQTPFLQKNFLCRNCEDAITEKPEKKQADILMVACPPWLPDSPPVALASLCTAAQDAGFTASAYDLSIYAWHRTEDKNLWQMEHKSFFEDESEIKKLMPLLKSCFDELLQKIEEENPRYIGFTIASPRQLTTLYCMRYLREHRVHVPFLIGGPGVYFSGERGIFSDESLEIACCVTGEGEQALIDILSGKRFSEIPGACVYENGAWHNSVSDYDWFKKQHKPVRFDMLDLSLYPGNSLSVEWSRGCVGECAFCQTECLWPHYCEKDTDTIIEELLYYRSHYPQISVISVVDSEVNGNPARLRNLLDQIIKSGTGFQFSGCLIARNISRDDALLLKKAGFFRVELGIETGSQRISDLIKKHIKISEAGAILSYLKTAGIEVVIFLIAGFPGETEDDFKETLEFLRKNRRFISMVRSVNALCLMEGSPIVEQSDTFGVIVPSREQSWGYKWVSEDGSNTPAMREERVQRIISELSVLGIAHELSGTDEFRQKRSEQKTVLINCPPWTKLGKCVAPLGLMSIASFLQRQGIPVDIVDCNAELAAGYAGSEKWNPANIETWKDADFVEKFFYENESYFNTLAERISDAQIVGISANMTSFVFACRMAVFVKNRFPDKICVMGGRFTPTPARNENGEFVVGEGDRSMEEILCTFRGKKIKTRLRFSKNICGVEFCPDYVVTGDGEEALYRIVAENIFKTGTLTGCILAHEKEVLYRVIPTPLDSYGVIDFQPDWSLYKESPVPIHFSRGCINRCAFCNDHYFSECYRFRDADIVFKDILVHYQNGRHEFELCDLVINANLFQLEKICDRIIENHMQITITGQGIIRDDMPDKLFIKMRRAGFVSINFGVESFSDSVLDRMGKRFRSESCLKVFKLCKKHGIEVHINLIAGFPGESDHEFSETVDFIKRYHNLITQIPNISPCLIVPNSPLESTPEEYGVILPAEHWVNWYDDSGVDLKTRIQRFYILKNLAEFLGLGFDYETNSIGLFIARNYCMNNSFEPAVIPDAVLVMMPPWDTAMPPLGIAYIAQHITSKGYSCNVCDVNIALFNDSDKKNLWDPGMLKFWEDPEKYHEFFSAHKSQIEEVLKQNGCFHSKCVGFSVTESNIEMAILAAEFIKEQNSSVKIVFGGAGVYFEYDRKVLFEKTDAVDYCVSGDGELPFEGILELIRFPGGGLPAGVSSRGWQNVPFKCDEYFHHPGFAQFDLSVYTSEKIPLILSRGCIFSCTFCNDNQISHPYRQIEPNHVIQALQYYYTNGFREFHFCDLLVNGDLEALLKIAHDIVQCKMYIEWSGQAAIRKEMNFEYCKALSDSGCQSLVFGAESFSVSVLKRMNKKFTPETAQQVFTACTRARIDVIINLIVGFPGETEDDFSETLDFVSLHRDVIHTISSVSTLLITPGCALELKPDSFGITLPETGHWKHWAADENTYEIRRLRLEKCLHHITNLKKDYIMDNLYEEKLNGDYRITPAAIPQNSDVLLIMCPPWGLDVPPLGIAYIAETLYKDGIGCDILDLNLELYNSLKYKKRQIFLMESYTFWSDYDTFCDVIKEYDPIIDRFVEQICSHPARILGFSVTYASINFFNYIAARIRSRSPDKKIVLGGTGTFYREYRFVLVPKYVDYAVVGEPETMICDFFRAVLAETPAEFPGVLDSAHLTDEMGPIYVKKLSEIPFPTFRGFNLKKYPKKRIPILLSRGCIRKCTFCNDNEITGHYRFRKGEDIFSEIMYHIEHYNNIDFLSNDLLVNGNLMELEKLCDLIIEHDIRISISGQACVREDMTYELMAKMKRAGFYNITWGIESFSDHVLKLMNKPYSHTLALRMLKDAKKAGLHSLINIIVGFPGETEKDFEFTCAIIKGNFHLFEKISSLTVCLLNSGTALTKHPEQFGLTPAECKYCLEWETDESTFEIRRSRLLKLRKLLTELHVEHNFVELKEQQDSTREFDFEACANLTVTECDTAVVRMPFAEPGQLIIGDIAYTSFLKEQGENAAYFDASGELYHFFSDKIRRIWHRPPGYFEQKSSLPAGFVSVIGAVRDRLMRSNAKKVVFMITPYTLFLSEKLAEQLKDHMQIVFKTVEEIPETIQFPVFVFYDRTMLQSSAGQFENVYSALHKFYDNCVIKKNHWNFAEALCRMDIEKITAIDPALWTERKEDMLKLLLNSKAVVFCVYEPAADDYNTLQQFIDAGLKTLIFTRGYIFHKNGTNCAQKLQDIFRAAHSRGVQTVIQIKAGCPHTDEKSVVKDLRHCRSIKEVIDQIDIIEEAVYYASDRMYDSSIPVGWHDPMDPLSWHDFGANNHHYRFKTAAELRSWVAYYGFNESYKEKYTHIKAVERFDKKIAEHFDAVIATLPPWGVHNPPVGLAYLAGYLKKNGLHVKVFDFNIDFYRAVDADMKTLWNVENKNMWSNNDRFSEVLDALDDLIERAVRQIAACDSPVAGFSVVDPKERITIEVIKRLSHRRPDMKIFIGGPVASTPEYRQIIIDNAGKHIEGFIIGEGEQTFYEIVSFIASGIEYSMIPGFLPSGKESCAIRSYGDLDSFNSPDYSFFDVSLYDGNSLILEWSRGCVGNCAFCKGREIAGNYRPRSAESIVDELEYIIQNYHIHNFTICDSVVNGNKKHIESVCSEIIKRGIHAVFSAQAIPFSWMDEEILCLMRQAGFNEIQWGVESGSEKILKAMNKLTGDIREVESVIRDSHCAGIKTCLFIIVGYPGETEEDFRQTLEFINRNRAYIDQVKSVNTFHIITGTPVHKNAESLGILLPECDYHYRWYEASLSPEIRNIRARMVMALCARYGIEVRETNIYEGKEKQGGIAEKSSLMFGKKEKSCEWLSAEHYNTAVLGPRILELDITNNCNLNCAGCWCHSMLLGSKKLTDDEKCRYLPIEKIREILTHAAETGVETVQLAGSGEPFLHPDIKEIITLCKKWGMRLSIITNMTAFTSELIDHCIDTKVDMITASVWAGDRGQYERTHPGSAWAWDAVTSNLGYLAEQKLKGAHEVPALKIYNVISALNCDNLDSMLEFARKMRAELLEFTVIDTVKETEALQLTNEDRQHLLEQITALKNKMGFPDSLGEPETKEQSFMLEQKEFGRYFHPAPYPDFSYDFANQKIITCPDGRENRQMFLDDRLKCYEFFFSDGFCIECDKDCSYPRTIPFRAGFTSLAGFGGFERRVRSSGGTMEAAIVSKIPCYAGWFYSRIKVNGDVIPCCKATLKPLGNIFEHSFKDIWFSKQYNEFRMKARDCAKSDPYFKEIGCFRSCDNLGQNLALHMEGTSTS